MPVPTAHDTADLSLLGGRLPLLDPAALEPAQRGVYDALVATVVPEARESGFTARLDDGRFIGPFNALLRVPEIATGLGGFTAAVARSPMSATVRQIVILTVGSTWGADFEVQAHAAAARAIDLPDAVIDAVVAGGALVGVGLDEMVAHHLARAVVAGRRVDDELYGRAVAAFGERGLVEILALIGQYQLISSILVTFTVPAPQLPGAAHASTPDRAQAGSDAADER